MKMTFVDAVKSGLKNYSNFKGTSTRTEFWYFYLFTVLLNMVTSTLDTLIFPGAEIGGSMMTSAGPVYLFSNMALILPNLSLAVRRFHDAGFSGKWLTLWVVPLAVFFASGGLLVASGTKLTASSTDAEVLAALSIFLPSLLIAAGLGIVQLIIDLKSSKTSEQGNKYAKKDETETSATE